MEEFRNKLNRIDDKIVKLFVQRMEVIEEISEYKSANGIPIKNQAREDYILGRLEERVDEEFLPFVKLLYKDIFEISRYKQSLENKVFGLVGYPLSHSKSAEIHKYFAYDYKLLPMKEKEFIDFLKGKEFAGVNVTIPYKILAMDYLDEIDPLAKNIGAVNTIVNKDGSLIGYNTDYLGLKFNLERSEIYLKDKKILILGSGGASKTCQCLAKDLGAKDIRVISRTGEYNYENLEKSKDFQIIINASPVGMYPDNLNSLVDLNIFENLEAVVDLVYNPLKTKLILDAEKLAIKNTNGLAMLVGQAYYSSKIFTGYSLPLYLIEDIIVKLEKDMSNITLIGMPGCGKTSLGRILSKKLNRNFIDTDKEIYKKTGLYSGEYIQKKGEKAFRELEEDVIEEISKGTGNLISTGGGSILSKNNQDFLRQNGFIIYLERDLDKLSTKNRPLSKDKKNLENLYKERKEIYESLANIKVKVQEANINKTIDQILKGINDEYTCY